MWKVKAMPELELPSMSRSPARQSRASSYRSYSHEALTEAFCWVRNKNGSIYRAAKMFGIPEGTLRDRVKGKIGPEVTKSGPSCVFSLEEETTLVNNLNKAALLGFVYSRAEVVDIASAYAVSTNKRDTDHHLTRKWLRLLMTRWPDLEVRKPRSLYLYRAKATSEEVVNAYYTELDQLMTKYKLKDAPERIFCVDEKGLTQNHSPRAISGSSPSSTKSTPLDATRDEEMTVTLIGAGNAVGQQLPPYFVFSGQQMKQEFLNGCSPGADGTVSDSGWSSAEIFKTYLSTHFLKYASSNRSAEEPILLLYDGYLSRTNLALMDWAREQNIVLFVMPAQTSRVWQPIDVECFGQFESAYNSLCHQLMQANTTTWIDRSQICEIACNAYTKALSPESLRSSFKKWGIYPLSSALVNDTRYVPDMPDEASVRGDDLAEIVEVKENDLSEEVELGPQADHSYADLPDSRPALLKERKYPLRKRKKKIILSPGEQPTKSPCIRSCSPKSSVGRAKRKVGVPKSTQKDRVKRRVDPKVTKPEPASVCTIYAPAIDVNECGPAREDDSTEQVNLEPQVDQSSADLPDLKPDLLKDREDSMSQTKENTCTSPVVHSRKRQSSYRSYSPTSLTKAFCWVKTKNESCRGAARRFGIPEGTLRDRVKGRIGPEVTKSGKTPVFSLEEESNLGNHLKKMGVLGFGYSRADILDVATTYAVGVNKREMDQPLSIRWLHSFMKRWPGLSVKKPRSLDLYRAKATSEEVVNAYYTELDQIMTKYRLKDAPDRIFSVDEKGLKQYQSPPVIKDTPSTSNPLAETSDMIVTIVGAWNALGQQLPPYFVFPGQCIEQELLKGCSPGADGTVSDSGRSSTDIFKTYLSTHFLKYVTTIRSEDEPLLILYDGHLSQINLSLIDWAREQNIVLFVLPSHTSRMLRPLDLGCFGPFESVYNSLCHQRMRANPTTAIDRHAICEIACNAYTKALTTDILRSSFQKWGVYPLNSAVVDNTMYAPALKAVKKCVPETEDNLTEEVDFDPEGGHSSADLPDLRPDLFKESGDSTGQAKKSMCVNPVTAQQTRARSYKSYSPTALSEAFCWVKNKNGSTRDAARRFKVPECTLRDRVSGKVDPEMARSGSPPVFSPEEEKKLVNHLNEMALLGFEYSRVEVRDIISAFAVILNRRKKGHIFGLKWYRTFKKRWPELIVKKPSQSLDRRRANATSEEVVNAYFVELDQIMTKYKLKDAPGRIFFLDDKGLTQNHSPHVIARASSSSTALDATRNKETVTLIGAGNALGQQLPPYFVFQGQRMRQELLNGCSHGAAGTVSDSGRPDAEIFKKYLSTHFLKCVGPNAKRSRDKPILLLYDGYLSRTNLALIDWARDRNIVLFVLPAHTSHVLQPLDLSCFGPFESIYNSLCHQQMQDNSTTMIDKYSICEIACNAYTSALTTDILRSSFHKWGIYPLNSAVVDSTIYAQAPKIVKKCVPETEDDLTEEVNFDPDVDHSSADLPSKEVEPSEDYIAVEVLVRENNLAGVREVGENCFAVELQFGANDFAEQVEVGENDLIEQVTDEDNVLAEPLAFIPQGFQSPADLPSEQVVVGESELSEQVAVEDNVLAEPVAFIPQGFQSPADLSSEQVVVGESKLTEQVAVRDNVLAEPVAFVPQGNRSSADLLDSRPDLSKKRGGSLGQRKKKTSISPEIRSRKNSSYRSYSSEALTKAVSWVKSKKVSIRATARRFGVPEGTLRDRVKGKVGPEVTKSGPPPLFSLEEESNLVNHLKKMCELGFGYSTAEVLDLATTYAVNINKRDAGQTLSSHWFHRFQSRWPELSVEKSTGLSEDARDDVLADQMEVGQRGDHSLASLPDSRPDLFKEIEDSIGQRKGVGKKKRGPSFVVSGNANRKKIAKYNVGEETSKPTEKKQKKRKKQIKKERR